MSFKEIRKDIETQESLLSLLEEIKATVRAGVTVKEWVEQKWVAAVDEYNECRIDCMPVRLAAACLVLLFTLSGCAQSSQRFLDKTITTETFFTEDGSISSVVVSDRVVQGRNRALVPPFGGKFVGDHRLFMDETPGEEGTSWQVDMGQAADIEGGNISEAIKAVEESLEALESLRGGP